MVFVAMKFFFPFSKEEKYGGNLNFCNEPIYRLHNRKGLLMRRIMPIRKISTKPLTKIAPCQRLPVV